MKPHRVRVAILGLALLLALSATAANVTNISSGGPVYATITGALAAAVAGDTLLVRSNVFNESPDINKNITIRGGYDPAFTIQNGITIITNGGTAGSVIDITGGAHVQLENVRLQGGSLTAFGGGLDVRDGSTAHVANCQIHNCRANLGGGVYARDAGTVVMLSNTAVNVNVASLLGGGIRAFYGARVVASGAATDIMNNSAPAGGGVAADSAHFELVNNADIYRNTAATRGGGILAEAGSTIIAEDPFTYIGGTGGSANQVTNGSGAGIYAINSSVMLGSGMTLGGNLAANDGGGVYLSNSVLLAYGAQIGFLNSGCTNVAVSGGGGGIFGMDSHVVLMGTTSVVRGQAQYGGGVAMIGGLLETYDVDIGTLDPLGFNSSGVGGGLYLDGTTGRLVNTSVRGNVAAFQGGGIAAVSIPSILLTNTVVEGNRAGQYGGLISAHAGPALITDTHVVSNWSWAYGGGVCYFYDDATVTRSRVHGNRGELVLGGIGLVFSATGSLSHTEISGNTASNDVGGLLVSATLAHLRDCQIVNNRANVYTNSDATAGGVYVDGTVEWRAEGETNLIRGNDAAAGGGVYVTPGSSLRLEAPQAGAPIVIENNTARSGGGMALWGGATAAVHGAVLIVSNTAVVGGGVFVSNMAAFVARDTNGAAPALNANLALMNGGGVAAYGITSRLDVLNVTIAGNRAHTIASGGGGGGVFLYDGASARLVNARVVDNLSSNIGGGVLAQANAELLVDSDFNAAPPALVPPSQFIGNHAAFQVGGVYVQMGSRGVVKNSMIVSNTAVDACGGFAAVSASGHVVNTVLAHNRGGTLVDGIAFQGAPFASLQHCTIVENGAIGLWTSQATPVTVQNTIIWGHTNSQIVDSSVTSAVNFCAIEGGHPGLFNITNYPDFVNRAALDFQLQPASPCIDKGATLLTVLNDSIGETRPYGLGWDIGAYEFVPEPGGAVAALLAAGLLRTQRRGVTGSGG